MQTLSSLKEEAIEDKVVRVGGWGVGGSRRVHRSHSEFLLAMGGQAPRVLGGGREPSVLSPSLSWGMTLLDRRLHVSTFPKQELPGR